MIVHPKNLEMNKYAILVYVVNSTSLLTYQNFSKYHQLYFSVRAIFSNSKPQNPKRMKYNGKVDNIGKVGIIKKTGPQNSGPDGPGGPDGPDYFF